MVVSKSPLRKIEDNEEQIDGLLDFAESVLRDPAAMDTTSEHPRRSRF
jgi:hypothetical protein